MKHFLYKGLAILLLVLFIDVTIGVVSDRVFTSLPDKDSMIATIYQSLFVKKADALVLGASTAHHCINTKILSDSLNLNVYNAGLDGRDIIYTDVVLQSFFERCTPRCVILDLSVPQISSIWINRIHDTKPYYDINKYVTLYYDKETNWQQRLKLKSSLYRYNKTLSYLIRVYLDPWAANNGYLPTYGNLERIEREFTEEFIPNETELAHFINIVKTCKEHNTKLIIVETPCLIIDMKFEKWCKKFCENNNILLIQERLNGEYYNHPDWFRDANHMNGTGADEYTKKISTIIKNGLSQ